jgi:molecular chaperone GrpE
MEDMEDMEKSSQEEEKGEEKPLEKGETVEEGAGVDEEIKRLREELEVKTLEAQENIEKEKAEHTLFANEQLIGALLPIIDNLERAVEHTEEQDQNENALESLSHGIKLILNELHSTLKRFGLVAIKAEGERFDPSKHEAMSHEESHEVDSDTVISEFRKGYFLKDRLLRPALVVVSKKPEKPKKPKKK